MSYSNISPIDRQGLTLENKHKLNDYEVVSFSDLKLDDHCRYTSNVYQATGRKLAYAVIHEIDYENKVMKVNGYKSNHDEEKKYPDWDLNLNNKYKNYIFYKKVNNNKC